MPTSQTAACPPKRRPLSCEPWAAEFAELAAAVPVLEAPAARVEHGLELAAGLGGDRVTMFALTNSDSFFTALKAVRRAATIDCGRPSASSSWKAERMVELARLDNPDAPVLRDLERLNYVEIGNPAYASYDVPYEGSDPLEMCRIFNETLESIGYAGAALTVFRWVRVDDTSVEQTLTGGIVGQPCQE